MGCGKQDFSRPEEEYEGYVFDLHEEVKRIEEYIREQEQHKKELEDEVR